VGRAVIADDADRAAGAKVCATRASEYVALGDGTIYDRATGLYWPADPIKTANLASTDPPDGDCPVVRP